MTTDASINRAIASGERNKKNIELIHNWCVHAKVKKMGGVGLIEEQTGLPIGHHAMVCDHAPAGGMAAFDLADAALDFHDRNCIDCTMREAVRLPNLSQLVADRDRAQEKARAEDARRAAAAESALSNRRLTRAALRARLEAPAQALIDDLDLLDVERTDAIRTRIVATAKLAPEIFSQAIVEHFFALLETGERWFSATGLLALQELRVDKRRLVACAMNCLATHNAIEVAASVIESNLSEINADKVAEAVPALISLARPQRLSFSSTQRAPRTSPLEQVFRGWPTQVCTGVDRLLDSSRPYSVMMGARSLRVLARIEQTVPLRFVRSLASKLARPHLLLDDDGTSPGIDEVFPDIEDGIALAMLVSPDETDKTLLSYYQSAPADGEANIISVYEHMLRRGERYDIAKHQHAYTVAMQRLVWAATTSKNDKVLDKVSQALQTERESLISVARPLLDSLLGAAVVMDDRVAQHDAACRLSQPQSELEALERNNKRNTLWHLREVFAQWSACSAANDVQGISKYMEIIGGVKDQRDQLSSALIGQAHHLVTDSAGLNAVLPILYSSLVGSSVLTRSVAVEMLGKLDRRQVGDLPSLVFEAFVPLLSDPYVIVHKSAVRALEHLDLPDAYNRAAQIALFQIILLYRDDRKSDRFLMDCIELFVHRYLKDSLQQESIYELFIALIEKVEPSVFVRRLRFFARKLVPARGYPKLVIKALSDARAMYNGKDDVLNLLYLIPSPAILTHRRELADSAHRHADDGTVVGSFIEVFTRSGAWQEATQLARAYWSQVPDTTRERPLKLWAQLQLLAVSYEAAIAEKRMEDLKSLSRQWQETADLIQKDKEEHAARRDPLRGFLGPYQSR